MQYIAILGRQPELGLIELESLIGDAGLKPFGRDVAVLEHDLDINRLGGTQKLARVIYRGEARDLNQAPLELSTLPLKDGKTTFGLSYYGQSVSTKFVNAAGINLKKRLKTKGSVRFVAPQSGITLSAAQVKFNGLLRNGFELVVANHRSEMIVAITEQIQDIDWYAVRDYQRPTRSAKVGMLPPKLAQILINTTSSPLVFDPFCGTGVIPQEALLLSRSALGSDIAPDMVEASKTNLQWLQQQRPDLKEWQVFEADAITVKLPDEPLSIVSEGYLGPNQNQRPSQNLVQGLRADLTLLYEACLKNWAGQMDPGTEVALTAPVWHTNEGWSSLEIIDRLPGLGYTLKRFAHANSSALIYRRPNQFVGRQLILARKN